MALEEIKNLYVGCALTDAPEDFRIGVEGLKTNLRVQGLNVFDFVGLVAGTPEDVLNWDIGHCVRDCDLFVAVCDYPSIGLGYEIAEATRQHKDVLAVAHESARVTRLLLGAAAISPHIAFQRYAYLSEIEHMVSERVSSRLARIAYLDTAEGRAERLGMSWMRPY